MRTISDSALVAARRNMQICDAAVILYSDNASFTLGKSDIQKVSVTRSINGGKYCIGGTEAATMTMTCFTSALPAVPEAMNFQVKMGWELDDGTVELLSFGKFATNTENVIRNGVFTTITAYDAFYWIDADGPTWTAPDGSSAISPKSMLDTILRDTGVQYDTTGVSTTGLYIFRPSGTIRDQIGQVAMASCTNAYFDGDGVLRFGVPKESGVTLTANDYKIGGFSTTPNAALSVATVSVELTKTYEYDSSSGYDRKEDETNTVAYPLQSNGLSISLDPKLFAEGKFDCSTSNTMYDRAVSDVKAIGDWGAAHGGLGVAFKGFSADLHGCAFLDTMDIFHVVDHENVLHDVCALSASWEYGGGIKTVLGASASSEDVSASKSAASVANIASQISEINGSALALQQLVVGTLKGDNATFNEVIADKLTAEDAKIGNLIANKADIDLLNVNNAWIENGIIKEGAISEAYIHDGAITNVKIADATIQAAKIGSIDADSIKSGKIRTQYLILTDDDGETLSIVSGLNAKAESNPGGILDGATIIDESIQAAKITVGDINAFYATIGAFDIGDRSIHSKKVAIDDPTPGIYIGVDGVGIGDGRLIGGGLKDHASFSSDYGINVNGKYGSYTNDGGVDVSPNVSAIDFNVASIFGDKGLPYNGSPFELYADGTMRLTGNNGHIWFDGATGTLEADLQELKVGSSAVVTEGNFNNFTTEIMGEIDDIRRQVDNVIETWYFDGEPTLQNAPAQSWTTEALKAEHVGDLYYDKQSGAAYRFLKKDDGTYYWSAIQDTALAIALQKASQAQDTADNKRRVFVTTPTTPYDVGDLWTDGKDIRVCTKSRSEGSYTASDWGLASDYQTSTQVSSAIEQNAKEIKLSVSTLRQETSNSILEAKNEAWTNLNSKAEELSLAINAGDSPSVIKYAYCLSNNANTPPAGSYIEGNVVVLDGTWTSNNSLVIAGGGTYSGESAVNVYATQWVDEIPKVFGDYKYIWTMCVTVYQDGNERRGYSVTPCKDIVERVAVTESSIKVLQNAIELNVETLESGVVKRLSALELSDSSIRATVYGNDTSDGLTVRMSNVEQRADIITTEVSMAKTYDATCSTAAATQQKVVVCDGVKSLYVGASIRCKFTYKNSAANPMIKVGNLAAKYIYANGARVTSSEYYWNDGETVQFYYDGTGWVIGDAGIRSRIKQSADSITLSVSNTYATKDSVPTKVSELTNDSSYATTTQASGYASTAESNAKTAAQGYADTAESNAKTAAQGYASTAESNAKSYTESSISLLKDSISLSVSDAKLGSKASITLSVGGTEETANIDMTGAVTTSNVRSSFANDSSSITVSAGTITFNSGKFALKSTSGANITTSGTIYSGEHSTYSSTEYGYYLGSSGLSIGSGFKVSSYGTMTANGTFTSGSDTSYRMQASGGGIYFSYQGYNSLEIIPVNRYKSGSRGGIVRTASGATYLELRAPTIATSQSISGSSTTTKTGSVSYITKIESNGNGTITWWTGTMRFINGMLVSSSS